MLIPQEVYPLLPSDNGRAMAVLIDTANAFLDYYRRTMPADSRTHLERYYAEELAGAAQAFDLADFPDRPPSGEFEARFREFHAAVQGYRSKLLAKSRIVDPLPVEPPPTVDEISRAAMRASRNAAGDN